MGSLGRSHLSSLFSYEEQERKKRLARDVCDTFAAHPHHVHDVTDADAGQAMTAKIINRKFVFINDSKDRSWFPDLRTSKFNTQDEKSSETNAFII